jgi:hypothetical protein
MVMARRSNLQADEYLHSANQTPRSSLAIYYLSSHNITYAAAKLDVLLNTDFFRLLVNETDSDPELFWKNYDRNSDGMPSVAFEAALKVIFPMDTMGYPTFTMIERLKCLTKTLDRFVSPESLENYLGIESLEAAYPTLEDSLKHEIMRVAINQWGYFSAFETSGTGNMWEQILRAWFVAGAKLEMLCSRETGDNPEVPRYGKPGDQEFLELIRQFVGPYAWHKASTRGDLIEARHSLKGFHHLISRTDFLLATGQVRGRFEICFDEVFMPSSSENSWYRDIDPHTLNLYYDESLSAWVVWNSMYEEHCGEFWDLFEHPERTMPGTWVD